MSKANKKVRINIRVTEYEKKKLIRISKKAGFDNFSQWVLFTLRKESK